MQNPVGNSELGIGDLNNAMYTSDVKELTCTNLSRNKRISNAGQESTVG